MKTTVILIRHGETDSNAAGVWQGHMDGKLSEQGRAQAEAIARRVQSIDFSALYSSDLSRALDTAGAIAKLSGHEVKVDPRLRERHLGIFQGLTPAQSEDKHPKEWATHRTGNPDNVVPEGESATQHRARALQSLNEITRKHPNETIVVVTHGGTLSGILRYITGIPMDAPRAWSNPNCGFNQVRFNHELGKWTMKVWGDTSHF